MPGRMQTFNMQRSSAISRVLTDDVIKEEEEELQKNSDSDAASDITKSLKGADNSSIASIEIDSPGSGSSRSNSVSQASVSLSVKRESSQELQQLASRINNINSTSRPNKNESAKSG